MVSGQGETAAAVSSTCFGILIHGTRGGLTGMRAGGVEVCSRTDVAWIVSTGAGTADKAVLKARMMIFVRKDSYSTNFQAKKKRASS